MPWWRISRLGVRPISQPSIDQHSWVRKGPTILRPTMRFKGLLLDCRMVGHLEVQHFLCHFCTRFRFRLGLMCGVASGFELSCAGAGDAVLVAPLMSCSHPELRVDHRLQPIEGATRHSSTHMWGPCRSRLGLWLRTPVRMIVQKIGIPPVAVIMEGVTKAELRSRALWSFAMW